jgi:hypothetical protein
LYANGAMQDLGTLLGERRHFRIRHVGSSELRECDQ